MKSKKVLITVLCVPIGIVLLVVLFFTANNIYQKQPHHITKVEDIKYLISDFEDIPIESCDCRWQADVMFMGGALETHSSGKLTVSKEYYDSIMRDYQWTERQGVPFQISGRPDLKKKTNDVYYDFITKDTYLVSENYQKQFDSLITVSKDEYCIYYFYESF